MAQISIAEFYSGEKYDVMSTAMAEYNKQKALAGLGEMYVCDERFKKNIDKHGVGTAEFISRAVKIYCNQNLLQ